MRLMMKKAAVWLLTATLCFGTNAFAAPKTASGGKEDFRALKTYHQEEPKKEEPKKKSTGKRKSLSIKKLPRELQEALDEAKARIPELKELELNSASIDEEDDYGPERWNFSLSDGTEWGITADLTIDANSGLIFSYEMDNDDWETEETPREKQSIAAADRFLKNIWGEDAAQYRFVQFSYADLDYLDEGEQPAKGMVTYQLYINKIPVEDFDVDVIVDSEGHILELNNDAIVTVSKSAFPNPKQALSPTKAEQLYKKLLDMSLSYEWIEPSDEDDEEEPQNNDDGYVALVYGPRFIDGAIDAFSGKISNEDDYRIYQKPKQVKVNAKGADLVVRTQDEAEQLLSQKFGISFDGLQCDELRFDDDDDEEASLYPSYRWGEPRKTKESIYIELWVDPQTGQVESYEYSEGNQASRDQNFTFEQAERKAVTALEKFLDLNKSEILLTSSRSPYAKDDLPDWIDPKNEDWEQHDPQFNKYSFGFADVYQGAEVGFSRYHVKIDPETGKVYSLELGGESDFSDLPDNKDTISASQATKIFVKKHPLKLTYVWPTYYDQRRPSPILLYQRDYQFDYIDAFSGKVIEE